MTQGVISPARLDKGIKLKPGVTPKQAQQALEPIKKENKELVFVYFGDNTRAFTKKYPGYSDGGICGVFAKKVTGLPNPESGIGTHEVDKTVGSANQPLKVGDIIITKNPDNSYHAQVISYIEEQKGDGRHGSKIVFGIMESNYRKDGKVTYGRELDASSPTIHGFMSSPTSFVESRVLSAEADDADSFGFSPSNGKETSDHLQIIRGLEAAIPDLKTPGGIKKLYDELDTFVDSRNWAGAAKVLLPHVKDKTLLKTLQRMSARSSLPKGWEVGEDGKMKKM